MKIVAVNDGVGASIAMAMFIGGSEGQLWEGRLGEWRLGEWQLGEWQLWEWQLWEWQLSELGPRLFEATVASPTQQQQSERLLSKIVFKYITQKTK